LKVIPLTDIQEQLFELKYAAKSLERCSRQESEEKARLKKAMEKQNMEGARLHAEAAIRKHNEALNLLRLSSRIDAMASHLQTALSMKTVRDQSNRGNVGEHINGKGSILHVQSHRGRALDGNDPSDG
jgi:hypothetical protein